MKTLIKVGTHVKNDIVIWGPQCDEFHARIFYTTGNWIIESLDSKYATIINEEELKSKRALDKYDVIKIGNNVIHWSDYLVEEGQELITKDFYTFHGRISRPNYRALIILFIGLLMAVYFIPGLFFGLNRRLPYDEKLRLIEYYAPYFHSIGFLVLSYSFIMVSIKRIRDTGYRLLFLLIPFYNLHILLSKNSNFRRKR